jgi:hypothetical protein
MTGVMRFLFALLLGVLLGAVGMGWLLQSGAGDFFIRRTEAVQDLERRLADAERQRDQVSRQLEDVVARATRMEQSFSDLERRFRTLEGSGARPTPSDPPAASN